MSDGQLYTNSTWRNAAGTTVLQTVGTISQDGGPVTGTLYMRGADWSFNGIPDTITFTPGAFIQNAAVTAHGLFVRGTQRVPALLKASFNDSNVTVDNCAFTLMDQAGHTLAQGSLLLRNAVGNYWVIEYAPLAAEEALPTA